MKVRYYSSFSDDFTQSANQNFSLPDDYVWVRKDIFSKLLSNLIYGIAVIFGGIYCKLFLHAKIRGRKSLRGITGDFFIFGNHTQPFGDVILPALCVLPKRIYTVVSTANYGIPIIGKILPFLGGLPVVNSLHGMKELTKAIGIRIENRHPVVIYPEAHVWEYYTKIRPFPDTAFKFPVKFSKPAFAMTVTYKKSKLFKRPLAEVFIDGPFYAKGDTIVEKTADLHGKVLSAMQERSKNSDFSYIEYKKSEP